MKLRPINITLPAQSAAIRAVAPTRNTRGEVLWPCMLTLLDGTVHPRAFCNPNPRYSDLGQWINPEDVARIEDSPHRLAPPLANQLCGAGESGMGYFIYELRFRCGRRLVAVTGVDWYLDFPDLPAGYNIADVVSVAPHKGRELIATNGYVGCAPYVVMDFVFHDDPKLQSQ